MEESEIAYELRAAHIFKMLVAEKETAMNRTVPVVTQEMLDAGYAAAAFPRDPEICVAMYKAMRAFEPAAPPAAAPVAWQIITGKHYIVTSIEPTADNFKGSRIIPLYAHATPTATDAHDPYAEIGMNHHKDIKPPQQVAETPTWRANLARIRQELPEGFRSVLDLAIVKIERELASALRELDRLIQTQKPVVKELAEAEIEISRLRREIAEMKEGK